MKKEVKKYQPELCLHCRRIWGVDCPGDRKKAETTRCDYYFGLNRKSICDLKMQITLDFTERLPMILRSKKSVERCLINRDKKMDNQKKISSKWINSLIKYKNKDCISCGKSVKMRTNQKRCVECQRLKNVSDIKKARQKYLKKSMNNSNN